MYRSPSQPGLPQKGTPLAAWLQHRSQSYQLGSGHRIPGGHFWKLSFVPLVHSVAPKAQQKLGFLQTIHMNHESSLVHNLHIVFLQLDVEHCSPIQPLHQSGRWKILESIKKWAYARFFHNYSCSQVRSQLTNCQDMPFEPSWSSILHPLCTIVEVRISQSNFLLQTCSRNLRTELELLDGRNVQHQQLCPSHTMQIRHSLLESLTNTLFTTRDDNRVVCINRRMNTNHI